MNPTLLFASLAALAAPRAQDASTPPGLVLIPGGRTRIGIEVKDVERVLEADPAMRKFGGALIAETPRQEVQVESYYLMSTEVTQDQYSAFVTATGARPPETWCETAIRAASAEFARKEERLSKEPGERDHPESAKREFEPHTWWLANGRGAEWSVPEADRARPVVFVDYDDARSFGRWAGLRLMTEFEFQRAVRGDTNQTYPWGNEWNDEKYAATSDLPRRGGSWPVASFPLGKSRQGVFDLAGNAWEWTASPFVPYPNWQQKIFEFGYGAARQSVNALVDWNADQRVVVGGSFQAPRWMARATVRRGTVRSQAAGALGFRCAASVQPGLDIARAVLVDDVMPSGPATSTDERIEYAPELVACSDGWRATSPEMIGDTKAPSPYARIEQYAYALFTPVAQIPAGDITAFEKRSVNEPVELGFLATNCSLVEPALAAGVYRISYRARGMPRFASEATPRESAPRRVGAPLEETLKLDVQYDHIIVSDLAGRPLLALREHVDYGPERESRVTAMPPREDDEGAHTRRLRFELCVPCKTTKKGFLAALDIAIAAPDPDVAWRR